MNSFEEVKMYQIQKDRLEKVREWMKGTIEKQRTFYMDADFEEACKRVLSDARRLLYTDEGAWQRDYDIIEQMVCRQIKSLKAQPYKDDKEERDVSGNR